MRISEFRLAVLASLISAGLASAQGGRDGEAGRFDHYVLALSWTPSWCEAEGDAREAPQCGHDADLGFVVHGLWPQHARGWPEFCPTDAAPPSPEAFALLTKLTGSEGLARWQWRKHGVCAGLSGDEYVELTLEASRRVLRPQVLGDLARDVRISPEAIEAAFLDANSDLGADGVTITCRNGLFREARICLNRNLSPITCKGDNQLDCSLNFLRLPKPR